MEIGIERVRLAFDTGEIADIEVQNNRLLLAAANTQSIVDIDLDNPGAVGDIPLAPNTNTPGLRLHVDYSGQHCLLLGHSEAQYHYKDASKFRVLPRLRDIRPATAVWAKGADFGQPDVEVMIIGSEHGSIHISNVEQAISASMFGRNSHQLGLVWPSAKYSPKPGSTSKRQAPISSIAVASCESSDRGPAVLAIQQNNLLFFRKKPEDKASVFQRNPQVFEIWEESTATTGSDNYGTAGFVAVCPHEHYFAAVYQGHLVYGELYSKDQSKDTALGPFSYEQCDTQFDPDAQIVLSQWHCLVLERKLAKITAISLIDGQIAGSVELPLSLGETVTSLCIDRKTKTLWCYGASVLLELSLPTECESIWRSLSRRSRFAEAYEIASSERDKRLVSGAWGHSELAAHNYEHAAVLLGQSSEPIEPVALQLLKLNELSALVQLLKSRLSRSKQQTHQILLTSWVCQVMVDATCFSEQNIQDFLATERASFDAAVIDELLRSRGLHRLALWFAERRGDIASAVGERVSAQDWQGALRLLREHDVPEVAYEYAFMLLSEKPKDTVETWMRSQAISPVKLVPALLHFASRSAKGTEENGEINQAVRYLLWAVRQPAKQEHLAVLHKSLVTACVLAAPESLLESLLKRPPESVPLSSRDNEFCLRLCLYHKKYSAACLLYQSLSLWDEAVNCALKLDDSKRAADIVDSHVEEDSFRERLFGKIAEYLASNNEAEKLKQLANKLKPEQLLALAPGEITRLDDLAPEVIKALETNNSRLSSLGAELRDSLRAAEAVHAKVGAPYTRYALVEVGEPCMRCHLPLVTRRFVVYPCQHGLHYDCVLEAITAGHEHDRNDRLTSAISANELNATDSIVEERCVLCTDARINEIAQPLVDLDLGPDDWGHE